MEQVVKIANVREVRDRNRLGIYGAGSVTVGPVEVVAEWAEGSVTFETPMLEAPRIGQALRVTIEAP